MLPLAAVVIRSTVMPSLGGDGGPSSARRRDIPPRGRKEKFVMNARSFLLAGTNMSPISASKALKVWGTVS